MIQQRSLQFAALALVAFLLAACGGNAAPGGPTGPTSVSVEPTTAEIGVGTSIQLVANADGTPTSAVTWGSDDVSIATVTATGEVTGVGGGVAAITATSTVDTAVQGQADITVVQCDPPVTVDAAITSDTLWTAQGHGCTDYVVTGFFDVTAELVVDEGTIVRFQQDAGLRVTTDSGSIHLNGTADDQVLFAGTDSSAGWWRGVEMWRTPNAVASNIDYAIIEHAGHAGADGNGYSLQLGTPGTTDTSDQNEISISNTVIRNGGGYGMRVTRFSEPTSFADVTITDHEDAPVWVSAQVSGFIDASSDLTGNGDNAVLIQGNESASDSVHDMIHATTWSRLAGDVPYRFDGMAWVTEELTVESGVTVMFTAEGELRVTDGGSLQAAGTAADPITFTGTAEQRGHWSGVLIWRAGPDAHSVLDHVIIEYAGGEPEIPDFDLYGYGLVLGSPTTDGSASAIETTLTNSTIRESSGYGLYLSHGTTFVSNGFADNTFIDNESGAVHVSAQAARWLDSGSSYDELVLLDATDSATDSIITDATWTALGDARYVVSGVIDLNAVLTLEPGVTLSFQPYDAVAGIGSGILSFNPDDAGLVAEGTATDPILLTGEVKTGGSWYGVYLREAREMGNSLDYVTIEYGGGEYDGGHSNWVSNYRFNLSVGGQAVNQNAQMAATNSTFQHSGVPGSGEGYGIYVGQGSTVNMDICPPASTSNSFGDNEQGPCLID